MEKNDTFELLGSRIHSKCGCLGSKSLWCNVPGPHITPGNFYDLAEKRTTFIRLTRNISPPTLDKWRVNSTGWPVSSESQVSCRISLPKFFPHDSNFWDDFSTDFQDSNLKGSKFWYFDPHEQSYFPKNPKHGILNVTSEALIVGRSK